MDRLTRPAYFSKWDYIWRVYDDWIEMHQLSRVDAALGFVLKHHEIDRVVVGMLDMEQLQEVAHAMNKDELLHFPKIGSSDEGLINPSYWSE